MECLFKEISEPQIQRLIFPEDQLNPGGRPPLLHKQIPKKQLQQRFQEITRQDNRELHVSPAEKILHGVEEPLRDRAGPRLGFRFFLASGACISHRFGFEDAIAPFAAREGRPIPSETAIRAGEDVAHG
jgi:hypothetical protein